MKYLKKLSLNEDKDKEFDKLYSIYLDRENLYNIIKDLMPDIPLLNDYNHGWIQTKKDNTGYFYFLSFKNPTYSKIKNTFKSDYKNLAVCCYQCNQQKKNTDYDIWLQRVKKN